MANRDIICVDCGESKWLSQAQWNNLKDEFETPNRIKRNFTCKECKKLKREDRLTYEIQYGKRIKKLRTKLKQAHYEFYNNHNDIMTLQTDFNRILSNNDIDISKVNYVRTPDLKFVTNIIILGIPLVNNISISIYTPRGKTN